jgi:molybdopterin converting factor small subunit
MPQCIKVHYYAQLRDAINTAEEDISMQLPILEKEILELLARRYPKQRDLLFASRVAVNEGYVNTNVHLEGFTEIDIISPVSGG